MTRLLATALLGLALTACTDAGTTPTADAKPPTPVLVEAPSTPQPEAEPEPDAQPEPDAEPEPEEPAADPPALEVPPPPSPEIEIVAWSIEPRTVTWTPLADPSETLALVPLDSGVLGKAEGGWYTLDEADGLVAVPMDVDPSAPIVGMWPDDAWFVQSRMRDYGNGDDQLYQELRLMRLRGGKRWVPQVYSGTGEQWFHPGTDDELTPRMSTRSGMLVYGTFDDIDRVGGRHDAPIVGPHRGDVVDFIETGKGRVYVLSYDDGAYYAQVECEDEACVAAHASRFPLDRWAFGRQVPRGRYSVSVLASSGGREFVLHHRGKDDGWILDELPASERPSFTWSSQEGGLWTLAGEHLRLRDTEANWYEVELPAGLTGPTVATTSDRKRLVVAGQVDGVAKLVATEANVGDRSAG